MLIFSLIKRFSKILFLFVSITLVLPIFTLAAEVFQVNSYNTIQIGDQNRIYKVQISCLNVIPDKQELAFNWLKSELPRRSKVNIKPTGYSEGKLISNVINMSSNKDIAKLMELEGLAEVNCS